MSNDAQLKKLPASFITHCNAPLTPGHSAGYQQAIARTFEGRKLIRISWTMKWKQIFTIVLGSQGDPGPTGVPGQTGLPGDDGEPGFIGLKGYRGETGDSGPAGYPGIKGVKGKCFSILFASLHTGISFEHKNNSCLQTWSKSISLCCIR